MYIYAINFPKANRSSFEFQKSAFLVEEPADVEPQAAAAVVAAGSFLAAGRGAAPGRLGARGGGAAPGRRAVDLVEERVRLHELVLLEDDAEDEVDEALLLLGRRGAAPRGGGQDQHGPPRPAPARGRRRRRRHGRHGAAKAHRRHGS
jgi:hypothetical protein